jgi:hypothetical protein
MWDKLREVQELGKGGTGVVTLYDLDGQLVVVKRVPLKLLTTTALKNEIAFFNFVRAMPESAKCYFTQLLEFDGKNAARIHNGFYEVAMTFSGNNLSIIWDNPPLPRETFRRNVLMDVCKIVRIAWEGGFALNDMHRSNLCWRDGKTILIDYGEIKYLTPAQRRADYRYANHMDVVDVLLIFAPTVKVDIATELRALSNSKYSKAVCKLYLAVHRPAFRRSASKRLSTWIRRPRPKGDVPTKLIPLVLIAIWTVLDVKDYCTSLGITCPEQTDDRSDLRTVLDNWAGKRARSST